MTIDLDRGLYSVDRDAVIAGAQVVYASTSSIYIASQRYVPSLDTPADVPGADDDRDPPLRRERPGAHDLPLERQRPGLRPQPVRAVGGQGRAARRHDRGPVVDERAPSSRTARAASRCCASRAASSSPSGGSAAWARASASTPCASSATPATSSPSGRSTRCTRSTSPTPSIRRQVGELKVAGYSAYLHPIGDGLLIGVGQDATAQGIRQGPQVSLFDVSDPAAPKRLAQRVLGDQGASTEAEWDHHAFLWWAPEKLAVLPLQQYGATVDAGRVPIPRSPRPPAAAATTPFAGAVGLHVQRSGIDEAGPRLARHRPVPRRRAPLARRAGPPADDLRPRHRREPPERSRPARVHGVPAGLTRMTGEPQEVAIRGDMIRLGQLLKLAGIAQDGGEAKALLDGRARARQRRGRAAPRPPAASGRRRARRRGGLQVVARSAIRRRRVP